MSRWEISLGILQKARNKVVTVIGRIPRLDWASLLLISVSVLVIALTWAGKRRGSGIVTAFFPKRTDPWWNVAFPFLCTNGLFVAASTLGRESTDWHAIASGLFVTCLFVCAWFYRRGAGLKRSSQL